MPRVKRGKKRRKRRKKILKRAKGFFGGRSRLHKRAREVVDKARQYAYAHRRQKKRNFRSLWIVRINAAARMNDMTYSQFMGGLGKAGVELNRKMLADIALKEPETFSEIVEIAKDAL